LAPECTGRRGEARRLVVVRSWTTAPSRWAEDAIVLGVAFAATLQAEWTIVTQPRTYQTDAMIHEFWMRRFQDSGLFSDPLTTSLLETGYSPPAFRSLFWLASHVVDPVFFGELLPLVLQPFSVWLVFRIVRAQVEWRPAAWIAGALFLVPWDVLRFSGGHPRAFAQPIVLLTVLLLLFRRNLAAALVPALGLLFYPPAGLTALAVVVLAALDPRRRPFFNVRQARWAGISVVLMGAAVLLTRLTTASQEVISAADARDFPEFGPDGQMHFFVSSTLDYLSQNYSGFFLQDSGSILAVAALLLLLVRPRNVRLLRWEVWCMPIAALGLFAVAHAVKFQLYLPHRYTYPLLPFFCIAVGVLLRPTFEALAGHRRLALVAAPLFGVVAAALALSVFPLGPRLSHSELGSWLVDAAPVLALGLVVGLVLAAIARRRTVAEAASLGALTALVAGSVLVASVGFADGGRGTGAVTCDERRLYRFLRNLPEDAIVAADPFASNCIPLATRRAVVISRKLYQPWALDFFESIRERMFLTVDAYYGPSVDAVIQLRERYGADYLVVRRQGEEATWTNMEPFTSEVERLRSTTPVPAVERLPERCLARGGRSFEVYDLACIATEEGSR
jgi:hypothetical protein